MLVMAVICKDNFPAHTVLKVSGETEAPHASVQEQERASALRTKSWNSTTNYPLKKLTEEVTEKKLFIN